MSIELLVFQIAEQRFGICSSHVLEVIRAVTLSPFPRAPAAVEGILNLRGRTLLVFDLRVILGLPLKPLEHSDHLVVVHSRSTAVALRVDQALDLAQIDVEERAPQSASTTSRVVDWVAKTMDGLVHVIDPGQLLSPSDLAPLLAAVADDSMIGEGAS